MFKQTSPNREPAGSTLRLRPARVFLAVWTLLADASKLFSYTRTRVRVYPRQLPVGLRLTLTATLVIAALSIGFWARPEVASAAPVNTINFQARLQTASGAIAGDGFYNVRFKLYNTSTGGSALWTESYLVSASGGIRTANGYLTANLGSETAFPSSINWGQQLYLTMEIGGTGSSPVWDGEMSPRLAMTSVPSAFALNTSNSTNGYTSSLSILQPTGGNQVFQVPDQGAAGTYDVCIVNSTSCGFAASSGSGSYIQNGTVLQNANFNISGNGYFGGKIGIGTTNPSFDVQLPLAGTFGWRGVNSISQNAWVSMTGSLSGNNPQLQLNLFSGGFSDATYTFTGSGITVPSLTATTSVSATSSVSTKVLKLYGTSGIGTEPLYTSYLRPGVAALGAAGFAGSSGTYQIRLGGNSDMTSGTQVMSATTTGVGLFDSSPSTRLSIGGTGVASGITLGDDAADPVNLYRQAANELKTDDALTITGLLTGQAGLTVSGGASSINGGAVSLNTSGTSATSIGNATGTLTLTGNSSSTLNLNGTILTATELNRLSGKDAALLDTNDAVGTSITGTGALTVGSIAAGFGTIATANTIQGTQLISTVATGTAPLVVASTTKVTNLNADLLDGLDSSAFCQGSCLAGGSASGDLTGTYPNPTIAKLQGSTLTVTTPTSGNILIFNGTAWVNQAVTGDISISTAGVAAISAGSIVNADLSSGSYANITGVGTLDSLAVTNNVSLVSGALVVGGTTVLTNGRTLQNVTYNGGTIGVQYGGTGVTSFTQYGLLFGNNSGNVGVTGAGTNGQCLVATTGSAPAWGSCDGGGGGVTLQSAYNDSLGGTTPEIVLDSSKSTLDIQAYNGQTADFFNLRAYSATGLGVSRFKVAADGAITSAAGLTVGGVITSSVNTGTAPLTVVSTTKVTNLNADLLDGLDSTAFALASGGGSYIQNQVAIAQAADFNINGSGYFGGQIGIKTSAPTHSITLGSTSDGIALYSTADQTTNYQRLVIRTTSTNVATYDVQKGGTGTAAGYHSFRVGGSAVLEVDSSQAIFNGNLLVGVDNVKTIGRLSSAPYRFRSMYLGTGFQVGAAANTPIAATIHGVGIDSTSSNYVAKFQDSSNADILSIRNDGNVGIGTSSPSQKLDVQGGNINTSGNVMTGGTTRIDSGGNLTNIGNIGGSGTLQMSGTSGSSYIMSALGLGITTPQAGAALTIGNGEWISAVDYAGTGYVNMFQVNSSNEIQVGAALNIDGGIILPTDGGQMTFSDLPISSAAAVGTPQSYTMRVGSSNALTVYGEADGAGNAQNLRVAIGSSINPTNTLDVGGTGRFTGDLSVGGDVSTSGSLITGGIIRLTSTGVLQNVSMDAALITSGTLASTRLSGSYTGVTTVGTLTSLTTSGVIISTMATGTAPLTVASTTLVTNLNADMVDGYHASDFALSSTLAGDYIQNGTSPQTANFNITGDGTVGGQLRATGGVTVYDFGTNTNSAPWYGIGMSNQLIGTETTMAAVQVAGKEGILFKSEQGTVALTREGNLGVGTATPDTLLHVGVTPHAATYPAQEVNGNYYCTAGDMLSGTTCTNTDSYAATYNSGSYSCPSGGTLSGTTCTYVYAASYQSAYYYCPSGGTLSGTTCNNNYNASYQAAYYSCPYGGSLSGTTCTQSATATYSCPGGGALQPDHTCYKEYPGKTTQADCLAAGHNWSGYCWDSYAAQVTYSCVTGWTLSGSSCTRSATYNAGYYYCPSGGTLSGTVCYNSYTASYQSAYYYCPSGGTLSGTTCTYTYTATLTGAGYTCPDGGSLSGTTCYVYTNYAATPGSIYYVCVSPAILSGTDCIAPVVSALFEGRVSIGTTSIIPLQYTRPAVAAGTPSFAPYTTYATGTSAYGVTTGDIDGDGDIDIVTSNYSSNTVSIFKNKGNGKFATKVDYATNAGPFSVKLADLDVDGDLDIVTSYNTSYTISIFKNNGNGTFATKVDYTTGTNPRDLTIADVDKDGDEDVVVSNYGSNTISVLKNNSDGTFAAKVDYTTGTQPIRLVSGDVDKDGDEDVVVANYSSNTISVFKNNSDGTFAAKVDYTTGTNPYNIAIGDLDADNDLDVAVANYGTGTISVFKNNSDGTFAAKVDYDNNGTAYANVNGLALVDIDGDNDLDIVAGITAATAVLYTLRNNGSGAGFGTSVSTTLSHGYVYSIATGDFDGNGKQDVVTANYSNTVINVLLNETTFPVTSTTYAAEAGISTTDDNSAGLILQGTPDQQAPMLVAQDANGNPWVAINSDVSGFNLLTVGQAASNTSLRYNKPATAAGSITFAAQQSYGVGSNPYIITEADLDNDGDIDIAAANYSSSTVSILKNTGTGTFTTQATYATATNPRGITAADVDGDGYKDVIVTNAGSNTISILKNNGNGTFATKVDYATGTLPYSVAAADLDGDGDQDVVTTNYNSATVSVLLNNGNGTFATKVDYATGSSTYAVKLADLDSDGDQDAVVTNYSSATISVLLNNGNGTFATKVDYATGSAPRWLVLADLDGDSELDIATANGGSSTISIFKGNGNGTFSAKTDYSSGITSPTGIAAVDLEGDGDLDLMMSSESYYYLYSLLNNGDAVYSNGTTYSGNYYNYSLVAADFNGDGRADMATPSTNNAVVSIFLNTTTFATPKATYVATMGISSNSATSAGLIIQGSTSQTAHLFVLQDSTGANLLTVDSTGKLQAKGTITGGVASPDYAENIGVSDRSIEAADVVTMDPARPEWAIKSSVPYDGSTLGVISTNPGFLTNASSVDEASAADQRPLALSGRVPVKVSTINGVIRQGDYLTSSEIPGVAMKATGPGAVIGVAMADFTGTEDGSYLCGAYTCGKVMLFINPSATNPAGQDVVMQGGSAVLSALTVNGALHADSINTGGMLIAGALKVNGDAEMSGYLKIGGDLTVTGTTRVANIIIGKHLLSNSDAPLVAVGSAAGQDGLVTIDGTDVAGTLNITVKARPQQGSIPAEVLNAGSLADVTFLNPYEYTPRIVVSPTNQASVDAPIYLVKTVAGWQLMTSQAATDGTVYQFDYVIVGSQGQASTSP